MPNLHNSGVNWRHDPGSEEMPAWRDDRASRSHAAHNGLEPGPDLPPRPSACGSTGGGKPDCGCGTNSAARAATGPDIRYAPPQPPTHHEGASLARLGKPDIRYAPPQPPTDHGGASLAGLGKPDIRYAPPQPPTDHGGALLARLGKPDVRYAPPQPPTDHEGASLARLGKPDIRNAPPQPPTDHGGASLARLGKPDIRNAPPQPPTDHGGASLARLGKPDIRYAPPQPPTDHGGASLARLGKPDVRYAPPQPPTDHQRGSLARLGKPDIRYAPPQAYTLEVGYQAFSPRVWTIPLDRARYLNALFVGRVLAHFALAETNPCNTLAPKRLGEFLSRLRNLVRSSLDPRGFLRPGAFEDALDSAEAEADLFLTRHGDGRVSRNKLIVGVCNSRYLFAAKYYWNEDHEVRKPPAGLTDEEIRAEYDPTGKTNPRADAVEPTFATREGRRVMSDVVLAAQAMCAVITEPEPCQSYIELDRFTIIEQESSFKTINQLQERNGEYVLVDSYRHGILVLLEFMCCPGDFTAELDKGDVTRFPFRLLKDTCCKEWLLAAANFNYGRREGEEDTSDAEREVARELRNLLRSLNSWGVEWPADPADPLWDVLSTLLSMYCCLARYLHNVSGSGADTTAVTEKFRALITNFRDEVFRGERRSEAEISDAIRQFANSDSFTGSDGKLGARPFARELCSKALQSSLDPGLPNRRGPTEEDLRCLLRLIADWADDPVHGAAELEAFWRDVLSRLDVHEILDILGMIPGIGELFDLLNALIYLAEGKHVEAVLCLIFMLPLLGMILPKGVRDEIAAFLRKYFSTDNPWTVSSREIRQRISEGLERPEFRSDLARLSGEAQEGLRQRMRPSDLRYFERELERVRAERARLERAERTGTAEEFEVYLRGLVENYDRRGFREMLLSTWPRRELYERLPERIRVRVRDGEPPFEGARGHHIVPHADAESTKGGYGKRARDILDELHISANDESNGVWLPDSPIEPIDGVNPVPHDAGVHSEAYYRLVVTELESARDDALARFGATRFSELTNPVEQNAVREAVRSRLYELGDRLFFGPAFW